MLSGVSDGDVGPRSPLPLEVLEARRQSIAPGRWRWLSQSHGGGVVLLGPEEPCSGREGDALVTTMPGAPVAVFAADCALVGLASPQGVVGAAHVGWRGLLAGVLEATVTTMRSKRATEIVAVLGACIGPECYEFSESDLESARGALWALCPLEDHRRPPGARLACRSAPGARGALRLDLQRRGALHSV